MKFLKPFTLIKIVLVPYFEDECFRFEWLWGNDFCVLVFLSGLFSKSKNKTLSPEKHSHEISSSNLEKVKRNTTSDLEGSIVRNDQESKSETEGQQEPQEGHFSQKKIMNQRRPSTQNHTSHPPKQKIHDSENPQYRESGKPVSCDSNLVRHEKIHSNEKHVCKECGNTFSSGYQLTLHQKIHTGERPY